MYRKSFELIFVVSLVIPMFVGCDRNEIKVYRVEKESVQEPVAAAPSMSMEKGLPPPSTVEKLEWTAPSHWEQKPASNMRYASFSVTGKGGAQADLSVISLAGEAGGVLANINRWRDQLGLSPITEAQFAKDHVQLEVLKTKVVVVSFANTSGSAEKKNQRILAAILPRSSSTWFFKMTGDDALVEAQKPAFIQFLKSLRVSQSSSHPVMAKTDEAPSQPIQPSSAGLKWNLPAGWKEMPASGMRKGSFTVSGDRNMQADVSIISLAGDVGGFLANVNRWRGQISLPPLTEADFTKQATYFDAKGKRVLLVNMVSPNVLEKKQHRTRIIGSILVQDGQCWFFKMMGDDALVESQKQAFTQFVKSTEIPHG
jgi:hypothetical protein